MNNNIQTLKMDCPKCDAEMSTHIWNLSEESNVFQVEFLADMSFDCHECGATTYLGELNYEVEEEYFEGTEDDE